MIYGVTPINWEDCSWTQLLRIFRFCVMPWKEEPEPTIKYYCLGRQVDVVPEFTTIQSFGQK